MIVALVIPSIKQGGAERVISELANHWAQCGHEVHLILLSSGEHFYTLHKGVIIHELGFTNLGAFQKMYSELKVLKKLRGILKTLRPAFVLSFMEKYNVFTLLATAKLGLSVYVSDRSNPRAKVPRVVDKLRNLTYRHAAGVIAQTALAKEILYRDTGNNNIKIIPNPLKAVTAYPGVERENIIINVGRLVPQKGQHYLLQAFADIPDTSWQLVILGDGVLKHDLTKQAKELNIENRVLMPGSVANVDEWLAKSSIFAFSSISEGFPNALVEAMAAGMPCVSFNCDAGPGDIIENGVNGYLVAVGDVDKFSDSLSALQQSEDLRKRVGEEAKKTVRRFEMSQIADQYFTFCTSAAKTNNR